MCNTTDLLDEPLTYRMDLSEVRDEIRRIENINIGSMERVASSIIGGLLIATGLMKRHVPGTLLMMLGGALLQRGMTGHCSVYGKLGIDKSENA